MLLLKNLTPHQKYSALPRVKMAGWIGFLFILLIVSACKPSMDQDAIKNEIRETEKAFEKMVSELGPAEAFYFFADENPLIKRGNDSLIFGKEAIRHYYSTGFPEKSVAYWTPDFIDVSGDGNMGWSYGKYTWFVWENDQKSTFSGIYQTIWKRQPDGSWKYVWD